MKRKEIAENYSRELEAKFDAAKERVFSAWGNQKIDLKSTIQQIDQKYNQNTDKISRISANLQKKNLSMKNTNKTLALEVERLKNELKVARSRQEMFETDTKAIETEVKIKIDNQDLKNKLDELQKEIDHQLDRKRFYMDAYAKRVESINKQKKKRQDRLKLQQMQKSRMEGLKILAQKIEEEKRRLQEDLEKLDEMRQELTHPRRKSRKATPSPAQKRMSTSDKYRQILNANNVWNPSQPIPSVNDDGTLYFNDIEDFTKDDYIRDEIEEEEEDFGDNMEVNAKIKTLESNIQCLLCTGQYTEDDDVIQSLRNQIKELSGK